MGDGRQGNSGDVDCEHGRMKGMDLGGVCKRKWETIVSMGVFHMKGGESWGVQVRERRMNRRELQGGGSVEGCTGDRGKWEGLGGM